MRRKLFLKQVLQIETGDKQEHAVATHINTLTLYHYTVVHNSYEKTAFVLRILSLCN